jgi:hypothetical protein
MDLWMDIRDDGAVPSAWAKTGKEVSGSKFDGLYMIS